MSVVGGTDMQRIKDLTAVSNALTLIYDIRSGDLRHAEIRRCLEAAKDNLHQIKALLATKPANTEKKEAQIYKF